jgi:hypothetical protein
MSDSRNSSSLKIHSALVAVLLVTCALVLDACVGERINNSNPDPNKNADSVVSIGTVEPLQNDPLAWIPTTPVTPVKPGTNVPGNAKEINGFDLNIGYARLRSKDPSFSMKYCFSRSTGERDYKKSRIYLIDPEDHQLLMQAIR